MKNKRDKLGLVLMTLMLFLALALGSVAPSAVQRLAESRGYAVEVWDGSSGLLAGPVGGGDSGGG